MQRALDAIVSALCRLVARIFFRRVEVVGLDRFPVDHPAIVAANHGNSLIDAMLLLGYVPVTVRFLAKSTLWDSFGLRFLMNLAGAIPVYRRKDPDVDTARNVEMFARTREVLAAGGAIALFPEGISHSEPSLQPLKTGVARILLEAEAEHGPLETRVNPVGLIFERRFAFRSRVLIQVGDAIDPEREIQLYGDDPHAAVRELTDRIEDALSQVTLNYASWREAQLIERAADIWASPALELPSRGRLSARFPVRQAFVDGYRDLAKAQPERVTDLVALVERYDRQLRMAGLTDEQVASSYPTSGVLGFVGHVAARLLVFFPLAAVGTLLNWLPYKIPAWATARLRQQDDKPATYKVLISLVVFPLFWLGESLLTGKLLGTGAGLVMAVLAPLSGYFALLFHEYLERFRGESRAYFRLRSQSRVVEELRELRHEIHTEVTGLAASYQPQASP